ncbi:unnamed protein product [Rotaria socialis]|uniref:Uncharacterized protein n=1 Tax=Rotaria socialis TaxID=392032 RepID=A0A817KSV0_9BILA|nr:unnamed protein product [Rotaria socialis]CAF4135310.1 unnamed protein product [Rotaria socialis]
MNNMFPPINPHSRPPSEDLRGVGTNGTTEIHSASKQQQIRRQQQQQTIDQQRRSPLRSNSLLTTTASRYVTAAAAAAAAAVSSPSVSVSPLVRSPSFVQNGSSAQFEPAKIIYRSSDYAWNDHSNNVNASNQPMRAGSPIKSKIVSSARHLTNGTLHESTAATAGASILHIPTPSSPQQNFREDMNNGDLLVSPTAKSRHTARFQRTNSHLDKSPATVGYGLPMRSESYRSSRLDYGGMRPRHTSSKQRNYVNSKTSFHEVNSGEFYLTSAQDENIYYHPQQQQQQQQMSLMSSTQRLNGSTLDITASRKPLSPNRTNTYNVPMNGTAQHNYFTSSQELHRSETNIDRNNNYGRFTGRGTTSKEQIVSAPKYRHSSTTPVVMSNAPGERHPSAQSYKSRDANISYAYTDVKKYIDENDLMSPEKEQIIRNWVIDVEKHRHHLQKFE